MSCMSMRSPNSDMLPHDLWLITTIVYQVAKQAILHISKKYSLANQSFLKMTTDAKKENFGGDSNLFLLLNVTVVETWN